MNTGKELEEALEQYLIGLQKIDQARHELTVIAEDACDIAGVEKRPFKAIARAMHEAPGSIEERINAMQEFIEMAFSTTSDELPPMGESNEPDQAGNERRRDNTDMHEIMDERPPKSDKRRHRKNAMET